MTQKNNSSSFFIVEPVILRHTLSHAARIKELSTRSDTYEASYRQAYSDYVKTSEMLKATLKMYRAKKCENAQLQQRFDLLYGENERLRDLVQSQPSPDMDFIRLEDALDMPRKTVANDIMGKSTIYFYTEDDVEKTDAETLENMIDAVTDDHRVSDEDMLERLRSMAL